MASEDEEYLYDLNELSESELVQSLEVYPFNDDEEWRLTKLRDEIVTAAKEHKCHDCKGKIRKGLRHRNRVETCEGFTAYRWCHACIRLHFGYPYGMQRMSMR